MMSGPDPDCMAAVIRGWRSLPLMNSKTTSAPSALEASGAWRFNSTSHAGMKSTQRRMLSRVPWANAGARPAARMPSIPAAAVNPATAVVVRNVRRSKVVRPEVVLSPLWVAIESSVMSGRVSTLVDFLEFAFGPLHGILGLHALYALGVHVHDDVLRVRLRGLAGRRPGIAQHPRLARGLTEDLQGLVDAAPHRVLFPHLGGADGITLVHLEPFSVVFLLVHPLEEILGQLLVLRVLHDRVLKGAVESEPADRTRRKQPL